MFAIGSNTGIFQRTPRDQDFLCTREEAAEWVSQRQIILCKPSDRGETMFIVGEGAVEFEYTDMHLSSKLLYDYLGNTVVSTCDPATMLMIKTSHRFKASPHFHKTRKDIQYLKNSGFTLPSFANTWLPIREKETYTKKSPKLNVSKAEFFRDTFYVYEHDSIHRAVAINGIPAYTQMQQKGAEVKVDKGIWDVMTYRHKLLTVAEEAAVLALERYVFPKTGQINFDRVQKADIRQMFDTGFDIAMVAVCTTLSSGWWREFAYENYDAAYLVKNDVLERFRQNTWRLDLVP